LALVWSWRVALPVDAGYPPLPRAPAARGVQGAGTDDRTARVVAAGAREGPCARRQPDQAQGKAAVIHELRAEGADARIVAARVR